MDGHEPGTNKKREILNRFCLFFVTPLGIGLGALAVAAALSLALWAAFFSGGGEAPHQSVKNNGDQVFVLYEEEPGQDLDDKGRQVDYALLEAMRENGLGLTALSLENVEPRRKDDSEYHFQDISLTLKEDESPFMQSFETALAKRLPQAALTREKGRFSVTIDGVLTHRVTLRTPAEKIPTVQVPSAAAPRLTVVIDDLGEDLEFARSLTRLDFPVSFAIWPSATHTKAVAAVADAAGMEILVHMPMEPMNYPRLNPGKDPLLLSMTADEIRNTVNRNVARVPGAVGVNNHMGSRFTEVAQPMNVALNAIKDQGLFFLDSGTTPRTKAIAEARRVGIRHFNRDIFLDNVRSVSAILLQLKKTESLALKRGRAICIGHPHRETLEALQVWARERNQRVSIVPLTSLE